MHARTIGRPSDIQRPAAGASAATAAALALLGGVLGVAGAYLALTAWHWRELSYLGDPPYLQLGVLILGLPAAGLVGGWLLGRAPDTISHHPLE